MKIPNPKWSIYIGIASSIFFGLLLMWIVVTSPNYCNDFCIDTLCDASNSCYKLNIVHVLRLFGLIFIIIFIPSYCFQILDSYIKRKDK